MNQLGLVDRILLGRAFTIAMNVVTLAIIVPITFNVVMDWGILFKHIPVGAGGSDPLVDSLLKQGTVGVVLVALGVVLEGRHTFVLRVMKVYHLDHLPGQEEFCDLCELFGFYLLVLGLLVECFGELVKFFDLHHRLTLVVFCGGSVILNVAAMIFLVQLILKISRLQLSEST